MRFSPPVIAAGVVGVLIILGLANDNDPTQFSDPAASAQTEIPDVPPREFDSNSERHYSGMLRSQKPNERAIYPWDSSGLDRWLDQEILKLKIEIRDPEVLKLAESTDYLPLERVDGYALSSYIEGITRFDPTVINSSAAPQPKEGLYLMLAAARNGDGFASFVLSNMISNNEIAIGSDTINQQLARRAADRDFLPAMVNLTDGWLSGVSSVPDEVVEAYLQYAFNFKDHDGTWNITNVILNELYKAKSDVRISEDLMFAALERAQAHGWTHIAREAEINIHLNGFGSNPSPARAVELLHAQALTGDPSAAADLGFYLMGEQGVTPDKPRAQTWLLYCLELVDDEYCANNLGTLFHNGDLGPANDPLALAFYLWSTEIHARGDMVAAATWLGTRNGQNLEASVSETRQARTYLEHLKARDFSSIPALRGYQQPAGTPGSG